MSPTMPMPSPSHVDTLSPTSPGRRWSFKSVARKALGLGHFRSQVLLKDIEPTAASPSILPSSIRTEPHSQTRKQTRTSKPDRKLPTTFDLPSPAHVCPLTSEPSSSLPSSPTPLSFSTSPRLPSYVSSSPHSRPTSPSCPPALSHPPDSSHLPDSSHSPASSPPASSHPPASSSLLSLSNPPAAPSPTVMLEDPGALSEEELTLKGLESQRAAILVEKQAAETMMHDNADKVHIYQKEFEVYHRAFVTAVTRLHELDLQLSGIRNGEAAGAGAGKNVDVGEHRRATQNPGIYWHDPTASDSDSDVESVY